MKNSLTVLALVLAAATPAAFIIELAGTTLPAIVSSPYLFAGFMFTFLFKILFADYAGAVQPLLTDSVTSIALPVATGAKDPLRLAA